MRIMDLLGIFLMFSALQPALRQRMLEASRTRVLFKLERKRKSRAIAAPREPAVQPAGAKS